MSRQAGKHNQKFSDTLLEAPEGFEQLFGNGLQSFGDLLGNTQSGRGDGESLGNG
jgi:hypothetical protein